MSESPPPRSIGPQVANHAAPWPGKPTLKGKFVTLEPLSTFHVDDLWKGLSGEENNHLYDYVPDGPFKDFETLHANIHAKVHHKEWIYFAIIDAKTNKALGFLSLMRVDTQNRCVEVGNVLFSPQMQKSPGGTECIYLLACYIFEDLGYRRFEWKANSLNVKSTRAAERLGFTFEGIFRQHMIVKDRNRDTAWYSMLDGEWQLVKQGFEKWLADGNFDESGKQKFSLQALRKDVLEGKSQ